MQKPKSCCFAVSGFLMFAFLVSCGASRGICFDGIGGIGGIEAADWVKERCVINTSYEIYDYFFTLGDVQPSQIQIGEPFPINSDLLTSVSDSVYLWNQIRAYHSAIYIVFNDRLVDSIVMVQDRNRISGFVDIYSDIFGESPTEVAGSYTGWYWANDTRIFALLSDQVNEKYYTIMENYRCPYKTGTDPEISPRNSSR